MDQAEGYKERRKEHLIQKLNKYLYGFKHVTRMLYIKYDTFMKSQGFNRSEVDHCSY